jgi:hypothetical protein
MKLSKPSVGYEHPARGPHHCRQCEHFEPPSRCAIVEGVIRPEDWCRRFKKLDGHARIREIRQSTAGRRWGSGENEKRVCHHRSAFWIGRL